MDRLRKVAPLMFGALGVLWVAFWAPTPKADISVEQATISVVVSLDNHVAHAGIVPSDGDDYFADDDGDRYCNSIEGCNDGTAPGDCYDEPNAWEYDFPDGLLASPDYPSETELLLVSGIDAKTACTDGVDNDCDGLEDAEDNDCDEVLADEETPSPTPAGTDDGSRDGSGSDAVPDELQDCSIAGGSAPSGHFAWLVLLTSSVGLLRRRHS